MARQVFYDPFGQRTQGFRQGVSDEMQVQDQTRRARASDYDFGVREPLRLREAQRQDQLGEYALPYQQRAYGLTERLNRANVFGAEQPIFDEAAAIYGDYAPARANRDMYITGMYDDESLRQPYAAYMQPMLEGQDIAPYASVAQQFGLDPQMFAQALQQMMQFGDYSPEAARNMDEYNLWDRSRQDAMDVWGIRNEQLGRQIAAQNAATQAYYTQRGQGGADAGGYTTSVDGL